MQVYEVPIDITPEGRLELPEALLERMNRGHVVRLIALLDESEDQEYDNDWARITAEQFLAGYGEADSIYDATK